MKYFFHLFITLCLVFIGELSLLFVLQFASLFTLFKSKNIFYSLYLPIIFLALAKLFASGIYLLYFLNLAFLFYFLYKKELLFDAKELAIFTLYMAILYGMYRYFEENIYQLYLSLEMDDKVNHIFDEVVAILALLHIFIFVILGYNKQKNI